MMTSLEWFFYNLRADPDPWFDPNLRIYFRLRNGRYLSHQVNRTSVNGTVSRFDFEVVADHDIPPYIAFEFRCYDTIYYQKLHKTNYLEQGEKLTFFFEVDDPPRRNPADRLPPANQ